VRPERHGDTVFARQAGSGPRDIAVSRSRPDGSTDATESRRSFVRERQSGRMLGNVECGVCAASSGLNGWAVSVQRAGDGDGDETGATGRHGIQHRPGFARR
jgi:hypothetical protein